VAIDAASLDAAPIPQLLEYMEHRDPRLRADAACALGDRVRTREIDGLDGDVCGRLALLLEDNEPFVRFEAAIALAEVQDNRATPVLLGAMHRRSLRLDAIRSLGTMGDSNAVQPLLRFMQRWLLPWADRLQAAAALCALGNATGAEYLAGKLNSRKHAERAAAIHFVGESRHPEAVEHLESVLADRNDTMRDVAARALGVLGDRAAQNALTAARETADDELRVDIDEALARLAKRPGPG
jgi:HEAT repeat protein